jgi:hypothetical protein
MKLSTANFTKPTPRLPRAIGNAVMFAALGVQPLILDAGDDIMTHRTKFWASFSISLVAGAVKGFTMMMGSEVDQIIDNEEVTQTGKID